MDRKIWSVRLSDISRHRSFLYGFAALWIMFLHLTWKPDFMPLRLIQSVGACGVEMFVLLTGFGLYRSLQRDGNWLRFYKKRFMRVFPEAVIVAMIYNGLEPGGALGYVGKITFLPFWLGHSTMWFVAFILTMYLLYPVIYSLQKKSPKWIWLLFALSLIPAVLSCLIDNKWTDVCRIAVVRIPVFLLSCIIAPLFEKDREIPPVLTLIALTATVLLFAFGRSWPASYFVRTVAYTFLAVFLIISLTWVAARLATCAAGKAAYGFMTFCGGISLEIYLLYSRVFNLVGRAEVYASGKATLGKHEIFSILLTFALAVLLQRIVTPGSSRKNA